MTCVHETAEHSGLRTCIKCGRVQNLEEKLKPLSFPKSPKEWEKEQREHQRNSFNEGDYLPPPDITWPLSED